MARGDKQGAACSEVLNDRDAERAAFDGIRAGADFVPVAPVRSVARLQSPPYRMKSPTLVIAILFAAAVEFFNVLAKRNRRKARN